MQQANDEKPVADAGPVDLVLSLAPGRACTCHADDWPQLEQAAQAMREAIEGGASNSDFVAMLAAAPEPPHMSMTREEAQMFQERRLIDELAALRKDAERWRAMRKCLEAVDWAWNSPPMSVAIFELHSGVVSAGPEGADAIADAAVLAVGAA